MGDGAGGRSEGGLDREALMDSSCLPRGLMSHCIAILKVILFDFHDTRGEVTRAPPMHVLLKGIFLGRARNPCKRLFKNMADTWNFYCFYSLLDGLLYFSALQPFQRFCFTWSS